jgi:hypothetical protein
MAEWMNAAAPPPLPDVPFARLAPVGSGAGAAPASYISRPVSRVARSFLVLPVPLIFAAGALLLVKQYRSGAEFTHDTNHKFIFFFDAVVFGIFCGIALLSAAAILAATWRRLDARDRTRAAGCVVTALVLAGLALGLSDGVFQSGKSRAYASVNAKLLVVDCAAMAAALAPSQKPGESHYVEGTDASVPAYIRSMTPRYVAVMPGQVEVIMSHDFMSGAYHESFIVPTAPLGTDPATYASQKSMTLISAQPPVFRWPKAK